MAPTRTSPQSHRRFFGLYRQPATESPDYESTLFDWKNFFGTLPTIESKRREIRVQKASPRSHDSLVVVDEIQGACARALVLSVLLHTLSPAISSVNEDWAAGGGWTFVRKARKLRKAFGPYLQGDEHP